MPRDPAVILREDRIRIDRIYDAVTKVIPPLIPTLESILNSLPDPE